MPNLSIKDVPEDLAESLRQRAARNHRSLQGELMAIIEAAAREDVASGNIKLGEPQSPSYTAKRPRPKTKKS
jgi:plasmid stability protein